MPLLTFAQSVGVDMTGWASLRNVDMSDDGLTLAGMGRYQGSDAAFLLTIPSPGSSAVLLLTLAIHRRRRVALR